MKNYFFKILSVTLLILISTGLSVNAQKVNGKNGSGPKKNTAMFINRTSKVIFAASEAVKQNKVYTGYLVKAKHHQKEAVKYFRQKEFKAAVKNSFIARRFAFLAYEANKQTVPEGWRLNQKEKTMMQRLAVADSDFDELKNTVTEEDKTAEATVTVDAEEIPQLEETDAETTQTGGQ